MKKKRTIDSNRKLLRKLDKKLNKKKYNKPEMSKKKLMKKKKILDRKINTKMEVAIQERIEGIYASLIMIFFIYSVREIIKSLIEQRKDTDK